MDDKTELEALILLDLQVDFLDAEGRLPIDQGQVEGLLAAARKAVNRARTSGGPIVAIGNEFPRFDLFRNLFQRFASMRGSSGAAWDPRAPMERDAYFAKQVSNAFSNPGIEPWLRERRVTRIRIVGLQAKACVTATARDALRRGFKVVLAPTEVGCTSIRSRDQALARLVQAGVELDSIT